MRDHLDEIVLAAFLVALLGLTAGLFANIAARYEQPSVTAEKIVYVYDPPASETEG